ncbi:MAG: HD domain-containing protein [Eubacteriaceae bacterium]|nr:HD domain-containing protein [Eubacteriaceae bacterium]
MVRVNKIIRDQKYLEYVEKNQKAEKDRIFCRHDMPHFLDVARIAWILVLEEGLDIEKEIVYAAALLHDTGRWLEYENGEDHAVSSARLSEEILVRNDFNRIEINMISDAIGSHRNMESNSDLSRVLYKSDKLSRNCQMCSAIGECKKFRNGEIPFLDY